MKMPKTVWLLVIGMLVNTTGNSFLWPMNTIYLHDHLGQSLTVAGFVLMLNAAAGVVGNLLGGYLFDKIGGYKTILFGIILTIVGLALLTIWHGWPQYVWLLALIGFSGGIVFPSMFALVGVAWPEGGRKGFNAIYLAQNLGVAVGPVLAGVVASYSFDYLFVANLIMYILFLGIAFKFKKIQTEDAYGPTAALPKGELKNRAPLIALCILGVGFLLGWLVYSQWVSTISTYTQDLGLSLKQYSALWAVNGFLIVLGQPLIAPIVRKLEGRYKAQILFGLSIFIVSFVVLIFAKTFTMFIVAMVILTFGEMFIWPVVPTLASVLAPKGKDGFFQGLINGFATFGRMLGPVVGGVLAQAYGMQVTFIVLIGILFLAAIPFFFYDFPLKRKKVTS